MWCVATGRNSQFGDLLTNKMLDSKIFSGCETNSDHILSALNVDLMQVLD
jgi:hypothetical protein